MKNFQSVLPLACSVAILFSLSAPVHAQMQEFRVEPVMSVRHSEPGLDTWYKLGRFHQENKRYDMAAEAYRQVLQNDPGNVEARNALATVYSQQNRFDEAIAEFETLLKSDPKLAYVYNNLGYARFLKADYVKAISAFGSAIALEPRNARAFGNLVRAYEQLGLVEAKATPASAASAAPAPVAQAKQPKAPEQNATAAAPQIASAAAPNPAAQPAAAAQAADTAAPADAVQPALAGIVIEIANGTRDAGLGEYVANALRQEGATVARVESLKPYTQRRNVILYRAGFHEQALAVSRRFTNPPAVVADPHQGREAGQPSMRLVLGKSSLQAPEATGSAK